MSLSFMIFTFVYRLSTWRLKGKINLIKYKLSFKETLYLEQRTLSYSRGVKIKQNMK